MKQKQLTMLAILIMVSTTAVATCYKASVLNPTPLLGNDGEIIELSNGTYWEVQLEYNYLYEYHPVITICPQLGVLIINGKKLRVQQLN